MTLIFPITLIVLQFCASVVYLVHGDIKHSIYWLAGSIITATVTLM